MKNQNYQCSENSDLSSVPYLIFLCVFMYLVPVAPVYAGDTDTGLSEKTEGDPDLTMEDDEDFSDIGVHQKYGYDYIIELSEDVVDTLEVQEHTRQDASIVSNVDAVHPDNFLPIAPEAQEYARQDVDVISNIEGEHPDDLSSFVPGSSKLQSMHARNIIPVNATSISQPAPKQAIEKIRKDNITAQKSNKRARQSDVPASVYVAALREVKQIIEPYANVQTPKLTNQGYPDSGHSEGILNSDNINDYRQEQWTDSSFWLAQISGAVQEEEQGSYVEGEDPDDFSNIKSSPYGTPEIPFNVVKYEEPAEDSTKKPTPIFDPGSPQKTAMNITPALRKGVRLALDYGRGVNFDLRKAARDVLNGIEPSLSIAMAYVPKNFFMAYMQAERASATNLDESEDNLETKQAIVAFRQPGGGLNFGLGRQRYNDQREWLYDEELDGAWLSYAGVQVAVGMRANENYNQDFYDYSYEDGIFNYALTVRSKTGKNKAMVGYVLIRDDSYEEQEDMVYYGLRAYGKVNKGLRYWADLAHVRGSYASGEVVRGTGLDIGSTYVMNSWLKPSLTLGYAFGSGDDNPGDGVNRNFRQPGFQDNVSKFNGISSLHYYGETLDPELSNMSIYTLGLGIRPSGDSSVDLVYHYYQQHKASTYIRDADIYIRPNGIQKDLGQEIDLVAAYRSKRNLKTSLALGWFKPGKALLDYKDAVSVKMKVRYVF